MPRGACLAWPDAYVYGDNGSYRRGLPQPVDRPSACVLKVWWAVARTHLISLQIVNSPYRCPTRWWRTACMVGHYLRVTPGFFCCQRVYSVVKRDLSQCCGSATRAPHWQFLLENRDEKSSGSGSQAHLPCPVGTLRKAVVGNLLASLPHLWRALIHSCSMTTQCHPSAS